MPAALVDALEKEDTPQSYGHAFLAASVIPDADLTVLFDHIEEIVAQADETETTLYVSGGNGPALIFFNGYLHIYTL